MNSNEIKKFLDEFYNENTSLDNDLEWKKNFENPVEIAEIIGALIDNNDKYEINMWIRLDKGVYINVTDDNADNMQDGNDNRKPWDNGDKPDDMQFPDDQNN